MMTFLRMGGGCAGAALLGAVVSAQVEGPISTRLAALLPDQRFAPDAVPNVATLDAVTRSVTETTYAHGISHVFLIELVLCVIVLVCVLLLPSSSPPTPPSGSPGSPRCRAPDQALHQRGRDGDRNDARRLQRITSPGRRRPFWTGAVPVLRQRPGGPR